ncbi:hypothetical protein [Nocardia vaccinii]|uniref:hypothetical protein n=1 Tax=Nocardia vaccinii TaxID=1822 RepID=UPI001FE174C3|nr:hypothetical protein [Nocardia vaccinii]
MDTAGERDVLGMWVGTGGEGAKESVTYLSDLQNWGVEDYLPRRLRGPQRSARCVALALATRAQ